VSDERSPLPETLAAPPRGRVLALVPHADDDVIGCGGTCALHAAQGDPVRIVVIYSGVAGDPDRRHEPGELARRRQDEARRGGAHLGLADYAFWGYPEGHVPGLAELLVPARRVAETVASYRPDHVYAPWVGEHHVDHHVAARVARMGLYLARYSGAAWGFEVWTPLVPTRIVDITSVYERKVAALREHASQLEYTDHVHKALGMHAQRSLYLPAGSRYGEAFRPLGSPSAEEERFLAEQR
jgi:LmbE family N-acetylglucosaminyl deacetylase